MASKKRWVWIARSNSDIGEDHSLYSVFGTKPEKSEQLNGEYWDAVRDDKYGMYCPKVMATFLPRSLWLKPGGGPVRVSITFGDE